MKKWILALFTFVVLSGCQSAPPIPADNNLWLEEVEGPRALSWVKEKNKSTLDSLEKDQRFKKVEKEMLKLLTAEDRIPLGKYWKGYVYNFWQDKKNVRGVLRRATMKSYKSKKPAWETILDVDQLAKKENENWVFKGNNCLAPKHERCMIRLSRGGKDASVFREFNLKKKSFVENGFFIPEAKSNFDWLDKDHLLIGTDFGPGTLTESGYPRTLRLWKRGTPLEQAKVLFEGKESDLSVGAGVTQNSDGSKYAFIYQGLTFYTDKVYYLKDQSELIPVPLPESVKTEAFYNDNVIFSLREDWKSWKTGDLLSFSMKDFLKDNKIDQIQVIYQPGDKASINQVSTTKSGIYLNIIENVVSRVNFYWKDNDQWKSKKIDLPENGTISTISADETEDMAFFSYESFTIPRSLYEVPNSKTKPNKIQSQPERFDGSKFTTTQYFATSKDGTKIPYFVVHAKNLKMDSSNPVLQYGYGGFEISVRPYNSSVIGKGWLEQGGVYVLANIRGGGEFGPKWHQAALKTHRQIAFDDFIAVSEDLIAKKITSPEKLSIQGGSNGGLLVGTVMVQRPDLYKAVVCQVPLLDMTRYHKLLAGASWVAEYGSIENKNERKALLKYSPYQNVKPGVEYPKALFITSTKDDRVHPGHARKMVKKMSDLGNDVFYYENIEGGHSAASNNIQRAHQKAIEFIYLYNQLSM